ncbi:MAG: sulfatase-like hydrolase/transferase [Planctomycetota bacterium]|nr:sulfatase-like hydrolase/transferase [Planctomycetota bacterium]
MDNKKEGQLDMGEKKMDRFWRVCLGVLAGCLAGSSPAEIACGADSKPRPNIVVLLADDLGFRDIGCYGGPVRTPTLDGLAKKGTRFTDFYSGCAVCSPSRATLLTGRHHIRAGVYSWIHDASQASHLLEREITLAEILKSHGYRTAHIGKWHLGLPTKTREKPTPDQHGFDDWFATWNNAEPSHRNPRNFIRNGRPVGEIKGYSCQIVVDEAIEWLGKHKNAGDDPPFFLNLWFHEPHAPIAAPKQIVSGYGDSSDKSAVYSGTIENTDRAIGRLLGWLRENYPPQETLIFYGSDNGSYREDRTGGLRGRKGANWEGGIRVPGIYCWPGKIATDQVTSVPSGLVDLLPTLCGLLEIEPPKVHLDGTDVSRLLLGKSRTVKRQQPLFWHLQRSIPVVAMRDGNYSLVARRDYQLPSTNLFREDWIPIIKSGTYKDFELYDLSVDRGQTRNLAGQRPELLESMKKKLLEINRSVMDDGADWHLIK